MATPQLGCHPKYILVTQKRPPNRPIHFYIQNYRIKHCHNHIPDSIATGQQGYYTSIHKNTGWFQKKVLNAISVTAPTGVVANRPIYTARYNPNEDDGVGNVVYAVSLLQNSWEEPTRQTDFSIRGLPLWMAFYGYYSYLKLISRDKAFEEHYIFVVKCKAIKPITQPTAQSYYPFIDRPFIDSTLPYEVILISPNTKNFGNPKATVSTLT